MKEAEDKEYARREKGQASSVIPAAIKPNSSGYVSRGSDQKKEFQAGAVSATDSESEPEFITQLRGGRAKGTFKWTPELEDLLEDILVKNQFDFRSASREFVKAINSENLETFLQVNVKQLQLRWTDIEIRKYRLPNAPQSNSDSEEPKPEATQDDELPPLEQIVKPEDEIDSR